MNRRTGQRTGQRIGRTGQQTGRTGQRTGQRTANQANRANRANRANGQGTGRTGRTERTGPTANWVNHQLGTGNRESSPPYSPLTTQLGMGQFSNLLVWSWVPGPTMSNIRCPIVPAAQGRITGHTITHRRLPIPKSTPAPGYCDASRMCNHCAQSPWIQSCLC